MMDGWKLVPVEPTVEMENSAREECVGYCPCCETDMQIKHGLEVDLYRTMLAAAPTPPNPIACHVDESCGQGGGEVEVIKVQYRVSAGPQTGWSFWGDGSGDEFRNSYQVEVRELVDRAHVSRLQAENAALQQRLNVADQRADDLEARAAELATAAASVKACLELPDGRSAGWEGRCLNLLRTALSILHAPAAKSAAMSERAQFMATIKEMWVNIGRSEKTWDTVHDWEEFFRLSGRKADAAPWAFNEALRCE